MHVCKNVPQGNERINIRYSSENKDDLWQITFVSYASIRLQETFETITLLREHGPQPRARDPFTVAQGKPSGSLARFHLADYPTGVGRYPRDVVAIDFTALVIVYQTVLIRDILRDLDVQFIVGKVRLASRSEKRGGGACLVREVVRAVRATVVLGEAQAVRRYRQSALESLAITTTNTTTTTAAVVVQYRAPTRAPISQTLEFVVSVPGRMQTQSTIDRIAGGARVAFERLPVQALVAQSNGS